MAAAHAHTTQRHLFPICFHPMHAHFVQFVSTHAASTQANPASLALSLLLQPEPLNMCPALQGPTIVCLMQQAGKCVSVSCAYARALPPLFPIPSHFVNPDLIPRRRTCPPHLPASPTHALLSPPLLPLPCFHQTAFSRVPAAHPPLPLLPCLPFCPTTPNRGEAPHNPPAQTLPTSSLLPPSPIPAQMIFCLRSSWCPTATPGLAGAQLSLHTGPAMCNLCAAWGQRMR